MAEPNLPPVQILLNSSPPQGITARRATQATISPKQITSFNVIPGLVNKDLVSLEAANMKGYFLRHKNFVLFLQRRDKGNSLFDADSSFRVVKDGDKVRFQASNFPDKFLTVRDDGIIILTSNSPLEKSLFLLKENTAEQDAADKP